MATIINYRLLLRGGPGTEWDQFDPVLMSREPGINTSTGGLKLGDGISPWSQLEYVWGGEDYNLQIGTVTASQDGTAAATLTGDAPNQFLNVTLPRGMQGIQGNPGPTGAPGPAPSIAIGTTTTGLPGTNAAATISGTSPNLVLSLTIPRGNTGSTGPTGQQGPPGLSGDQGEPGPAGPPNTLTMGTVTTGLPGSTATGGITGVAPNQTLNLTIPRGDVGPKGETGNQGVQGNPGPANTLTIGTVTALANGATPTASITGTSPAQTLNLGLPTGPMGPRGFTGETGPSNTLTMAPVVTGAPGTAASAVLTGTSPEQTLTLTIPRGDVGPVGEPGPEGPIGERGPKGDPGAGVEITGSVATAADLDAITGMTAGDAYVAQDTGLLHVYDGTVWLPGVPFKGDRGVQGEQGVPGPGNALTIGTVTTASAGSAANASITGASPSQILNLTIPRGDKGDKGDTGNTGAPGPGTQLAIGSTTTGAAGSTATVGITGTAPNQTLSFTIPRGDKGEAGTPATITGVSATNLAAGASPTVSMGGTLSARTFTFGIPTGNTGAPGPAPNLAIGTVTTLAAGGSASVTLGGTNPNYTLSFGIPTGPKGDPGTPGAPNTLAIGTVSTGAAGTAASATVTGTSPNQTLNLTIPRGNVGETGQQGVPGQKGDTGATGPANVLTIGSVVTGATGTGASADITGTTPAQTLNLTIPRGDKGDKGDTGAPGPGNSLTIGTVTTGAEGASAAASISGAAPTQTLNLTIPRGATGPTNSLTIGTVSTLLPGESATATLTGTAPNQILDLGLPTAAGVGMLGTAQTWTAAQTFDAGTDTPAIDTRHITVRPRHTGGSASMFLLNENGQEWEFFANSGGSFGVWNQTATNQPFTINPTAPGNALTLGTVASLGVPLDMGTRTIAGVAAPTADDHAANRGFVNTGLATKSDTTHTHTYSSLTGTPTTFTPSAHNHAWSEITSGVPTTFPPSTHQHAWSDITSGVPTTFTPSAHVHAAGDVTSGTFAAARIPLATASAQGGITATLFSRLNGAVSTATASTLALRDAAGRAQFADPAVAADAATMGWVTTGLSGKAASTHTHAQAEITNLTTDLAGKAPSAAGLPTGGTAGQRLVKTSATNYATAWTTTEWHGTQAAFDAISPKDANVTYFVTA